jgi:hypothetical protein
VERKKIAQNFFLIAQDFFKTAQSGHPDYETCEEK